MKQIKTHSVLLIIISLFLLSCEDIIYENDISGQAVMLTAPVDGAVLTETTINLSWEPLEGASDYHIQIATPSFGAALQIVRDSVVTESNFLTELDPEAYQWRVKARNSAYETGFTTHSFTINE